MTIIQLMMCKTRRTSGGYMDLLSLVYFEIPCVKDNYNSCRHLFTFFGGDPEWYL